MSATTEATAEALNRLANRFAELAALRSQGEASVLKVLIAEDDLMIADMIEDILLAHGYEVCGIARTVADAVTLALLHKPDLAVLDLRLADNGIGTGIAAQLHGLGRLGILYETGNATDFALTSADGDACLSKPYRPDDLLRSLQIVADIVTSGKAAQPPFPAGFQLLLPPMLPEPAHSHA